MSMKNRLAIVFTIWLGIRISTPAAGLDFPMERQVIQRNAEEWAEVTVAGTAPADTTVVEVKADLGAGFRGKAADWTIVAQGAQIRDGKFSGSLKLATGGWYSLKVRFRKSTGDQSVLGEASVSQVGVGDVFVTAGQSNSANYGNPRQKAKDDRVVYFDGKGFVPAKDPIPGGSGGGGSPWALLGDRITRSQQIPVCFRSASLHWTEVAAWLPPDTQLYRNLVACVRPFGTNGVRAVLWHQGESDTLVKTSAEAYCDRVKTIVETLNQDAGYQIPWLVAQASFHPGSKAPEQQLVAKGQQLLWEKKICRPGPVTDDLLGAEFRHDGVHFNQKGLATHADRWFKALSGAFQWKTYSSTSPEAEFKRVDRPVTVEIAPGKPSESIR